MRHERHAPDAIRAVTPTLDRHGRRRTLPLASMPDGRAWASRFLVCAALLAVPVSHGHAQSGSDTTTGALFGEPVDPVDGTYAPREVSLYRPTLEWRVEAPDVEGNPFDVIATATFVHQEAGDRITTELFYDGDDGYRFRFTGTRLGTWTFTTTSDVTALDGLTGSVEVIPNEDTAAYGFYQGADGRIAVPVGDDGHLQGVAYQVFMHGGGPLESIGSLPREAAAQREALDALLDEADEAGFNALFVGVWNNWFSLGAETSRDHDSVNPDPATFRLLETLITHAHARGMGIHIWQWGDEQRRWTQVGVGGIGGDPDLRLQRYIAARLGPLPGWTMGYGFDLHEWVSPDQVLAWAEYLEEHMGWSHLLTAREQDIGGGEFYFDKDGLSLVSNDLRPLADGTGPYQAAREAIDAAAGRPVIFERRFLYRRDDLWSMDATRRALWQFTMAGGAGSIWGTLWDDGTAYPKPGQLRSFREFWRTRLDVDLSPTRAPDGTLLLASPDGDRVIAYGEDVASLTLPVVAGGSAVAIDTLAETYEEIALEPPADTGSWTWEAPRSSDWAVAFEAR